MACRVYGYTPISVPTQNDTIKANSDTIKVNRDTTELSTGGESQKIRLFDEKFYQDAKLQRDSINKIMMDSLEQEIMKEKERLQGILNGNTPEQIIKQYYEKEYRRMIEEDIRRYS